MNEHLHNNMHDYYIKSKTSKCICEFGVCDVWKTMRLWVENTLHMHPSSIIFISELFTLTQSKMFLLLASRFFLYFNGALFSIYSVLLLLFHVPKYSYIVLGVQHTHQVQNYKSRKKWWIFLDTLCSLLSDSLQ